VVEGGRSGPGRYDLFIVTDPSATDAELGSILVYEQENRDADLLTPFFFEDGAAMKKNNTFAYGEFAATVRGRSWQTGQQVLSKIHDYPHLTVERYPRH
jgi:hypothetical protein